MLLRFHSKDNLGVKDINQNSYWLYPCERTAKRTVQIEVNLFIITIVPIKITFKIFVYSCTYVLILE